MTYPYGMTVTIVRPGAPGFGGDPGTPAADRTVDGCVVYPGDSRENTNHSDAVVADLTVIFPPDTDILPTDQVRDPYLAGVVCEVIGAPEHYLSPFTGRDPGVVVRLRRNTG